MLKLIFLIAVVGAGLFPLRGWAQEESSSDNDELQIIEVELEKATAKKNNEAPSAEKAAEVKEASFSGLGTLAPFSEVSVIQKRYMPKTGRFQFYGGLNLVTNNPFFETYGVVAKGAYFLNETWGVEGNYFNLTTSEAKSTKELKDFQNVSTDNLIYPKDYLGLDVLWFPMYGKFSLFGKKIIPFDMYFSGGYGVTGTQSNEKPGTLHFGTGQIFSVTKGIAVRWDFSWHSFSAKGIEENSSNFNFLFLSVGASFFFPEASYR